MENILLVIHLILAFALIGIVLLQRSEGGGLGIGGGGGGGVMSGRSAASALSKVTWALAVAFFITSISLTAIAANRAAGDSVIERLGTDTSTSDEAPAPAGLEGGLLPPTPELDSENQPKADE